MSAFDKIIGYEAEKKDFFRIADAWSHSEKYRALGVNIPRAILLYGKPGLGKTLFADALIAECGLPCFPCRKDCSDGKFVDMIASVFAAASEQEPSIVFLDDIDKFAEDNSGGDSNKEEFAVIQTCMETVRNKDVFVIATANDVYKLPDSLLRAGRFGRQIHFSAPTLADAVKIIQHYLSNKKIDSGISIENLALILQNQSCAVLESVINEAGLLAGFEGKNKIGKSHLIRAFLTVRMHAREEKPDLHIGTFAAYHEAGHAIAALACGRRVGFISVFCSEENGGVCVTEQKSHFCTLKDILDEAMIALSGKAAIETKFGQADVGCHADLEDAIDHMRPALTKCCAAGFSYGYDWERWDRIQSSERVGDISVKLYGLLEECYRKAMAVLAVNRDLLDRIANALLTADALLEEDMAEILAEVPLTKV